MSLRLYNTLTKQEEEFSPLRKGKVTMYTCGPTVYGRPHIGNYASFLMADLLRRWLEAGHGYSVTHVKNITDVGHLLHDADHGDDKIQKEAEKEKIHPLDIARRYEREFLEDERALNMLEPSHRPRASDYIKEQLTMINVLLAKGHAYQTDDGIYFEVSTFSQYGALSGNTVENIAVGKRVDINECKKHPADFALWKKCTGDNGKHILRWVFESGEVSTSQGEDPLSGFPGWHIECSAMSWALLGDQIDIHTGGEDNIFPHHECEIAQSESVCGVQPFVRYWLHRRRIDIGSEKMSKSIGNVLSLDDITAMGYSTLDLRYYLLSVHYRTNLKFTKKGLDDARKARRKVWEWMGHCEETHDLKDANDADTWQLHFTQAMDDDLNTPKALSEVFDMINAFYRGESSGGKSLKNIIRHTFGCFDPEEETIPIAVQTLADRREEAREGRDFAKADALRTDILALGYEIRDEERGPKLRKQAKK